MSSSAGHCLPSFAPRTGAPASEAGRCLTNAGNGRVPEPLAINPRSYRPSGGTFTASAGGRCVGPKANDNSPFLVRRRRPAGAGSTSEAVAIVGRRTGVLHHRPSHSELERRRRSGTRGRDSIHVPVLRGPWRVTSSGWRQQRGAASRCRRLGALEGQAALGPPAASAEPTGWRLDYKCDLFALKWRRRGPCAATGAEVCHGILLPRLRVMR